MLPEVEKAEAQSPYNRQIIVGSVLVDIFRSGNATPADVDSVYNTLNAGLNGSLWLRNSLTDGNPDNIQIINVVRDSSATTLGKITEANSNGTIFVDVGDINAFYLGFTQPITQDEMTVTSGFLIETLAHEINHTSGIHDSNPNILDLENHVLNQLNKGYIRNIYSWCDNKGTASTSDDESGINFTAGGPVSWNGTMFTNARPGLMWDATFCPAPPPGVGGVAESPNLNQLNENLDRKNKDNTLTIATGFATAAAAVTATGAAFYINRRRASQNK